IRGAWCSLRVFPDGAGFKKARFRAPFEVNRGLRQFANSSGKTLPAASSAVRVAPSLRWVLADVRYQPGSLHRSESPRRRPLPLSPLSSGAISATRGATRRAFPFVSVVPYSACVADSSAALLYPRYNTWAIDSGVADAVSLCISIEFGCIVS